jgi:hypothetical protein
VIGRLENVRGHAAGHGGRRGIGRLEERDNEILIQPVTKEYIQSVCGLLKSGTSVTQALLKERAKDKKREEAKFAKLGAR